MRFEIEEERGVSPLQILRMDANEIKKARTKWILYLPRNVYTSKTLVKLSLAGNRFVVDVPSLPCLPWLQTLVLLDVVYKDENSHVRLLADCPALSCLEVFRDMGDNVTRFIVKVPSLKSFTYSKLINIRDSGTSSLVLDSPGLRHLNLSDPFRDHGPIQNMPHLEMAYVHCKETTLDSA
uniref:F-box/LRR-repeat protein 15/At3g58940/PEG3-like LRR domain-containing protein n=1 Tax=Brassica oleracea var. oleracea TaxID=109376 RepID=A0A0D3CLD3_BRAOL